MNFVIINLTICYITVCHIYTSSVDTTAACILEEIVVYLTLFQSSANEVNTASTYTSR